MLRFPIFDALEVAGYQLYPDKQNEPGLIVRFARGPWIVMGVNGLGKSTLLLLLKFIISGSVQLREAGFTGDRSDLINFDPRFFSARVNDGAAEATACVKVRFGQASLRVERQLSNLRLIDVTISSDGEEYSISDEDAYRKSLASLMGVARFEDALRVFDRVIFFLEDRQPLIWDVSAQFEVFRALLAPSISQELRTLEADIVSNDSAARNLSAALYKLMNRRNSELKKAKNVSETRARLAKASAELNLAENSHAKIRDELSACEERRADSRLELKRLERAADEAANAYEEIKFNILHSAFANVEPSNQYILLKLIADHVCLACGNTSDNAAQELERRRDNELCLVCGAPLHKGAKANAAANPQQKKAVRAFENLVSARQLRDQMYGQHSETEKEYVALSERLEGCLRRIENLERDIRRLRAQLPAHGKRAAAAEEDRIQSLRREVENFRRDRDKAEVAISKLLTVLRRATEKVRISIEDHFRRRVRVFSGEDVRLVYAARKARIGQGGREFEFPAFEIEMTGGTTAGAFVRRTAEQVSQSQREYLDIIFRMSLFESLGAAGCSLVIDGPEGSLDAVFSERAGELFSRFAQRRPASNIVLACNVVEGGFIPNVLSNFRTKAKRETRIINLLDIAAPTAALIELKDEYRRKVSAILRQGT